jgi:hypothetical protein
MIGVLIGAAAFGLAHGFITGAWMRASLTPDPAIRPWFTNSTGAVLLTATVVAAGALAHGLAAGDRRAALMRGVTVGVGAIVAMLALVALGGATVVVVRRRRAAAPADAAETKVEAW